MTNVYGFASLADMEAVVSAARQVRSSAPEPLRFRGRAPFLAPFRMEIGKADSAISQGTSGSVSIWNGDASASLADSGDNESAYARFDDVPSGGWVLIVNFPWGWEIVAWSCA